MRSLYESDDTVWASVLAARLARAMELPHGNLWEPGYSRHLIARLRDGWTREQVAELAWISVGAREHA